MVAMPCQRRTLRSAPRRSARPRSAPSAWPPLPALALGRIDHLPGLAVLRLPPVAGLGEIKEDRAQGRKRIPRYSRHSKRPSGRGSGLPLQSVFDPPAGHHPGRPDQLAESRARVQAICVFPVPASPVRNLADTFAAHYTNHFERRQQGFYILAGLSVQNYPHIAQGYPQNNSALGLDFGVGYGLDRRFGPQARYATADISAATYSALNMGVTYTF